MSDRSRAISETKQRAPRTARADKAQETERRLIDAAAKVVGAEGYANASVAKITALADVAQGTFYNYFGSQQDLFDHLLPELGGEMLEFIRGRVTGIADSFAREEAGFRAFFAFLEERPEFYRILNEAETFSPKAFRAHMRNMADGYLRALSRSHAKGEMPGFDARELEVVVYCLLAARNYLAYRYVAGEARSRSLPGWVAQAYMKLVTGGMRFGGTTRRAGRRALGKGSVAASTRRAPSSHRIVDQAPGLAGITLDIDEQDRDADGRVRSAVLVELMQAAGALAVRGAGDKAQPRLESISVSFIAPTKAAQVSASARLEGGSAARHVAVRVFEAGSESDPIVTAQAIYAVGVERGG